MVESGLELAKELRAAAAAPERSPVRPTLRVAEIEDKFGTEAVGFIGNQIKKGGLKIDGVPQEKAIKKQMGVLIAADQKEKEDFLGKGAGYEVDGGKYTYAFLPIKDITDYKESETQLIKGSYDLSDGFKTLEAIIEQGGEPEEGQSLDPDSAQEFLDVLTAHTEVTVVFGEDEQKTEKKLTYEQWKSGQLEDKTAIPEDAEVSFQLVGKGEAEEPEEELKEDGEKKDEGEEVNVKELREEMEDFNAKIAKQIKELAKKESLTPQQAARLNALLTTHLIDPLGPDPESPGGETIEETTFVQLGHACKDIAVGLASGDQTKIQAAVERIPEQKNLLRQAALEAKQATAGESFDETEFNEACTQIESLSADRIVNLISNPEELEKMTNGPEFKKSAKCFDEKWRAEFCRRLFGKTEITKEDFKARFKKIGVPEDAWDKFQRGLMTGMWIFMMFSAFKEVVESITPGEGEPSRGG